MAPFKYEDLGLVNTKDMFSKALAGGFAVPAYNFNNLCPGTQLSTWAEDRVNQGK
jgi:hypothetical protein